MENSKKLAILASLVHLSGYAVYNITALRGVSEPNLVPWAIWGLMAVLNNETYKSQTGDRVKAMLTTAGSLAAVITFVVALFMGGSFREMSPINAIALAIGLIAVTVWKFGSPKYANFCVLAAIVAGFVPFFKILWANPAAESPSAWLLWSVSTTLGVAVVAMRYDGKRADLIMPMVLMFLHMATLCLTLRAV